MGTPTGRGEIIQKIATTEHKLNRVDFKETAHQGPVRRERLQRRGAARAAAQAGLQGAAEDDQAGRSTRSDEVADAVASAMKDWAIEKGATHFTHLFQPMTGLTAEKHDSFLAPDRRRQGHRRVQRQGTGQGRTGRQSRSPPAASAPPSRPAATPPGTRPAPPYIMEAPERRDAGHPDRVPVAGPAKRSTRRRRCLRSMEALSHAGPAHPASCSATTTPRRSSPPSARSRNTS